jgi:hypothetical protein
MKTSGEITARPHVFLNPYYKNYIKFNESVPASLLRSKDYFTPFGYETGKEHV